MTKSNIPWAQTWEQMGGGGTQIWFERGCATRASKPLPILTLIYPAHFEDVPCQSGVNHIYEGKNDYVSRQVIYHCKEECLSFIKKQTEIQMYKFYASYAHEFDVKRRICHRSKRNEIQGAGKLGLKVILTEKGTHFQGFFMKNRLIFHNF